MRSVPESLRSEPVHHLSSHSMRRPTFTGLCLLVIGLVLSACGPVAAQPEATGLPGLLNRLFQPPASAAPRGDHLLTPADAPLVVSRKAVLLQITNAYDPSGVRYLALQLRFRNPGATPVTVNTKASQLIIGNEEFLRVQVKEELQGLPIDLPGESQSDVEKLQGTSPLTVPAHGRTAQAWLLFAKLPKTRDLPPLTLKLDTSVGPIEIDLTQKENEALTCTLERFGPSGRIGIARLQGEINVLNAPHFAKQLTEFAEAGVSRLVIDFDKNSRIGDDWTSDWLTDVDAADNERLQYYPQWTGLLRGVVLAHVPGKADETGANLAHSEAEAIQKVTRDFIPGLDAATLQREVRSGHPLFQRAILLNAGEPLANDDCDAVLRFLKSPERIIRHAAIQSLRAAVVPEAIVALEEIVRQGSREEAALALQSLKSSQQTQAQDLALQLASDPAIQKKIGLPMLLRTLGGASDERWLPFLQQAFQHADPVVRRTALAQLLRLGAEDRLPLLLAALADKDVPVRELAFNAMVARRSVNEQSLFVREAMRRVKSRQNDSPTLTALREIRDPTVLPQLWKWFEADPENGGALVTAIVEIGGTAVLDELAQRFSVLPRDNRSYLLRVFAKAKHPAGRLQAVAGLLDEDDDYRELCRWILMELGDAEAVAALVAAIHKTASPPVNPSRGEELARSLGQMGSPEAVRALETMQASDNPIQKGHALTGLATRQSHSPILNWLQAANHKTQQNEYEEVIQLLNIALEIDPQSGRLYNALGFAQLRMSKGGEAKPNFEKALKLMPEDHNPLTGIAICLALEGRCDEAIAMVDTPPQLIQHGQQQIYLYNVACVYGRSIEHLLQTPNYPGRDQKLGDFRKKAILFLQASVQHGFEDLELLASDADLAYLREMPEFKKLPKLIQDKQLQ